MCRNLRILPVTTLTVLVSGVLTAGGAGAAVAPARAQSTQPATAPVSFAATEWPNRVQALARALAGSDLTAVEAILAPAPAIRGFSSEALQTPARLLGATTGSKVLGVHAYPATPKTLASDLATDIQEAGETVPESTRQQMIPPDEAAARRANETAAAWIASTLKTDEADAQPTAVILLWPVEHKSRREGPARRATFVLVKGERHGDRVTFRQIVFGDPLEAPLR
jgi:hypothetical protein